MQEVQFAAPKDTKEILKKISTLTFKQRLKYGADIGRKCANADDLIQQLRDNPPPAVPNVELDEGLCKILEPQQRNVSKYYHQHQIALTALVSTKKHVNTLKQEVQSQSKFFKKYVIKHFVKQQPNDEEIVAVVKSVPPAVQKKIIHCLIKEKRTAALDILCEEMRKIAGVDYIVDFLHGCSSEKVRESLNFKNIFQHKSLRWDKLFRFHQAMIIQMMSDQLDQATLTWGKYNAIYTIWTKRDKNSDYKKNRLRAWEEMLQTNTYQSKALWQLVLKYPHSVIDPCLTYKEKREFEKEIAANGHELKTFSDIRIKKIVPDFVRDRFNYFTRRNPDLFLQFVQETTVMNLRGVLRHSIPGKLWCQKDFKPEHIFAIMEIAKAKSNRKLLWPYHELVGRRNMAKWTYNIYTGPMSAVCELQYGSKLKTKVGFDHLLICQITRAKTKKSVFFSFGPGQMEKLINFIYDWMEQMKPRGVEADLYDQMGWIELLNQWTTNWLSKLYTKRNKKEGTNRYSECIALLLTRWQRLWDKFVSNEWRDTFPQRMTALEKLAVDIYDGLKFWKVKCEHETRQEPTHKEEQFAKQLENLITRVRGKEGSGYHCGKDKIKQLCDGFGNARSGFYSQFGNYRHSINIDVADKFKTYRSRRWPLKGALQSIYSLVQQFITHECHAQYAFDYFVSFHVMRNVRKIRSKERYDVLNALLKILYERRPMYYAIKSKDAILNKQENFTFCSIFRNRLSEWLALYEQIISEIWDECLDKKRVQTEYGWNLAKSAMEQYLMAYQFIIEQNELVSTDISHWFYANTARERYGFFRAGGNNTSFQKKPFSAPSIVRSILQYITNRRINRADKDAVISLTLVQEMYDYYLVMLSKIKPASSRHCLYVNWVTISEESQRQLIEALQQYLSSKQPLIDEWDRLPDSKEEEEDEFEDVVQEKQDIKADDDDEDDEDDEFVDDDSEYGPIRPTRGRGRGRGRGYDRFGGRGRGRGFGSRGRGRRGRGRGRGRGSKRDKHFIKPKVDPLKAARRKKQLMRDIMISTKQKQRLTREGVEFVRNLFPFCFDALLEFYSKPARANWVDDRNCFQRIYTVLDAWHKRQQHTHKKHGKWADEAAKAWNSADRRHHKLLSKLQERTNGSYIAPKQEAMLLQVAGDFGRGECKTQSDAQSVQLPQLHGDNQKLLLKLRNQAGSNWGSHIDLCARRDRTWLDHMMHIADLFEQHRYVGEFDYIYKIFSQFVPVFQVTQFWRTHEVYLSILVSHWRRKHLKTMQRFCAVLTRTVNTLDAVRKTKIDLLKQAQHKRTKEKEDRDTKAEGKEGGDAAASASAMDVDTKTDGDTTEELKDGTFESQEISRINVWISEIINKCFELEFRKEYTEEPHKWWSPDLLYLFEYVILYAPNDDFANLFGKLSKAIVEEMRTGNAALLSLLIRRLQSEMRCKHQANWEALWECFMAMRSKLENKFDDYCCDLMINLRTTSKQREIIFAVVATDDHLKILCNQRPKVFVNLFGALCDFPNRTSTESRILANGFLDFFLAEDELNASPDTKDQLLRYLDVRDHKIRKRLAKLTDSNSVDEREAGYRTLITATLLVNDAERDVQIKRTVKFFMTKLKNEAIDRREMGLEILFGELASQTSLLLESDDCLKYLSEMLQDCLEVQDLDKGEDNKEWENIHEHRVLRHFLQVSVDAIELGCKDMDGPLFEFGVDLQWRMCVFRKGNTEAAQQFRINLGALTQRNVVLKAYLEHIEKYGTEEGESFEGIFFYQDEEDEFVDKYMKAYESRTKIHFAEYLESSVSATSFMEDLFLVLGSNWHKSKVLIELLEKLIQDFEDLDLVLDEDESELELGADVEAATAKVVCYVVEFNKHNWIDIKVLGRFVTALFNAFKTLHEQGHDDCLRLTQKTLVFMLDSLLYEYTKDAASRKRYKDDWSSHAILKLLIESCMKMLSVTYPQKHNGRFWRMQWELHKVFRSRMMKCDADIDTILHVQNVNDLPTFRWSLFANYWRVCLEGLQFAVAKNEKEFLWDADDTAMGMDEDKDDDKEDEKMLELEVETAKERKGHKERVISLFKSDEERAIWRLELAVWCVDMACQWIWGGDWLEIAQSPVALLIQSSVDWKGFMIIPTQTVFSTLSKPLLRFRWNECDVIKAVFKEMLRSLQIIREKDIEGLRVFEKSHPAVVIFEKLITKYHTNRSRNIKMRKDFSKFWFDVDLLNEYMNVIMHSRQIKLVLWRWWAHNSTNKIVKQNGRKTVTKYVKSVRKRTAAIDTLLKTTKSAIYLRFVWRHLLQYDQNKLTTFLESGSCFRGVFYLRPDDRKYTRKQQRDRAARKKQQEARYAEAETKTDRVLGVSGALKKAEIDTRTQRRGGGKEATRRVLSTQAAKRKEAPKVEQELSAMEQVKQEFEEQQRFETAFEDWQQENVNSDNGNADFDHRDIWCFEGCYQLNRLLPGQLDEIGKRHIAAAMNTNRGMPERVKSIIRWTLLPNTTYFDIVEFFNEHESDKLPINLLEALMKGVMENDEVLAPMHYLLQPKFLSSQQARIAAFAIQKCVPHIPRRQYTNLLRAVLSGKRRNALKVTAYKQIIRMLIQRPSRTHIRMVVHEWDRDEVHRDVRIVILQAAFDFIRRAKPISFGSDAAWHIFETAVTHPFIRKNIEIMTALMGCTIEGQERIDSWYEGLVLKPRLLDHLQCFKETPIPKKHAARWAKIIVVLCDRVYTEYVEKKEEGAEDTDVKMDDEVDVDMDVDGEATQETKQETKQEEEETKMEVEEAKEAKVDDGSGPYLINEGKPRCLDDIAYIAMRSLEMWVKYNDSIVRDALRVVGETIADFNVDFIAHDNEDIHKVNWARFEMACDILKKTLKFTQSNIRSKFLPVITDIVGRFDAIINASLEQFVDVYKYGDASTFTVSDKYAQSRDYIGRVYKRLGKFFEAMGTFHRVPIEYYKAIISPLDSGASRGMYTDIVMKKRWEMLSNTNTRTDSKYVDLGIDYIQDLIYYGCLDANFANNEVMKNCQNILQTLNYIKKAKVLRCLMRNFPERHSQLYLPQILKSEQYGHLRHCMINYVIDKRLIGGEVIRLVDAAFISYFKSRIKHLVAAINGPATDSLWRETSLTYSSIEKEISRWLSFAVSMFGVQHNHKQNATLYYHKLARQFFDLICKRANVVVDYDNKRQNECSIEDWIYLKLFNKMCASHMNILVVLYGQNLISLIKMPIFLAEKRFIRDKPNPFVNQLTVSQVLDKMWGHLTTSYFYNDWDAKRYQIISKIFSWLLHPQTESQRKVKRFRKNVLLTAIKCLKDHKYQGKAWEFCKTKLVQVWDMIVLEKCTIYDGGDDEDEKEKMETDPVLLGNEAVEMYKILRGIYSYMDKYNHFRPLFNEILSRAVNEDNKALNRQFYQRVFLELVTKLSMGTIFMLHNKLQKVFDLSIQFTCNPPADGRGGLSWSDISTLIYNICCELSPKWSTHKILNKKATVLIEGLFKAFNTTKLTKQAAITKKAKVYRNVCIFLLCRRANLVQYALTNKLAATLKYLIDLWSVHNKLIKKNPENICFDRSACSGGLGITQILKLHINSLNTKLYTSRSVEPVSGALICQIYKTAINKKHKNNAICGEILYDFMSSIPNLLTQAIFSPDLVNMVSWSIDYATDTNKNIANIRDFIAKSSQYLSPTFDIQRGMHRIAGKYYKLLVADYCNFDPKAGAYKTKRVSSTISELLKGIINSSKQIKWLIMASGQESMNLIFAVTLQCALNNLSPDSASALILKYIQGIQSESSNLSRKYWKRINIDNYSKSKAIYDDDAKENNQTRKKTKLSVAEMYTKGSYLQSETLQIIHKIFQKEIICPLPLDETQNAIWNDYMSSNLMPTIMRNYGRYLLRKENISVTNTFIVSLISYLSQTPLRYKGALKLNLINYFLKDLESAEDDGKAQDILKWVQWMLAYRKEMNKSSRDILTRLALSLVVHFGHESCKKAKRIQHEMIKETVGDEESDDDDAKSDATFESESDDVITWQPQWVQLLNEFGNDENAVIRMTTRQIKTVFVDWEQHKTAQGSWVKDIVENKT